MIHDTLWVVECDECGNTWEFFQPYWENVHNLEATLLSKGWALAGRDVCPECREDHDDTAA